MSDAAIREAIEAFRAEELRKQVEKNRREKEKKGGKGAYGV